VAFVVFFGGRWGLMRCRLHNFQSRPAVTPREHKGSKIKYDLVNRFQLVGDASDWSDVRCYRLHGDAVISEIELMYLLDRDEAEFPEAAVLAASLIRRGWVSRMPAKYQALVADFIRQGIVSSEITEVKENMKPRIRLIIEDGQPTIAESIGCPIEITVVDKTNNTTVIYSTHEGESHPIPLFGFDGDGDGDDHSGEV